jgi:hypothetical protein
MRRLELPMRLILAAFYFAVAFVGIYLFYRDDPFCMRPGSHGYARITAQLSSALAAWDFVASVAASAIASAVTKKYFRSAWSSALPATLIAGCGFFYLPFWIYRGYGVFRFQHTWADASCFFTEGYFLLFLFFLAPLLTLTSFLRELLIVRWQRRRFGPD